MNTEWPVSIVVLNYQRLINGVFHGFDLTHLHVVAALPEKTRFFPLQPVLGGFNPRLMGFSWSVPSQACMICILIYMGFVIKVLRLKGCHAVFLHTKNI